MDKIIKNFNKITYGPAPEDSKEVYEWIKNLNKPNKLNIRNFLRNGLMSPSHESKSSTETL